MIHVLNELIEALFLSKKPISTLFINTNEINWCRIRTSEVLHNRGRKVVVLTVDQ